MIPARKPRQKDEAYLRLIRQLPCLVSGRPAPSEAAHIRFAAPLYGKRETGAGEKPDDRWTVPLSAEMHRLGNLAQHNSGERGWWEQARIDPVLVALELHAVYMRHVYANDALPEMHRIVIRHSSFRRTG